MNPNQKPYPTAQPAPAPPGNSRPPAIPAGTYPNAPGLQPSIPQQPAGAGVYSTGKPSPDSGKKGERLRSIFSTLALLVLAPLIAILITAFAFQSYQVEGASMETTLSNHDRLIVNKLPRTWARVSGGSYIPARGDIIIFNQTGPLSNGVSGQKQLIKRVIGLPGERVVVRDGKVMVVNAANPEGFNPDESGQYEVEAETTPGEVDTIVEEDEVFVMGDNRSNSEDSRYFGPIKSSDIASKLMLRVAPFDKFDKF